MLPKSFDPRTAREVVGDDEARALEASARADAEAGMYQPPKTDGQTYWDQVTQEMRRITYLEQYVKRLRRLKRKANEIEKR